MHELSLSRRSYYMNGVKMDFLLLLQESARIHGHFCPGQVLGVRMSLLGLREIGISEPRGKDKKNIYSLDIKIGSKLWAAKDHNIDELCDKYIRNADIIVTEGFKRNGHPKIEVFRSGLKIDLISRGDENLLAVAGDKPPPISVPCFNGSDVNGIVNLIENRLLR